MYVLVRRPVLVWLLINVRWQLGAVDGWWELKCLIPREGVLGFGRSSALHLRESSDLHGECFSYLLLENRVCVYMSCVMISRHWLRPNNLSFLLKCALVQFPSLILIIGT